MDPSYNNSFGGFGTTGQPTMQQPVVSGGDIVMPASNNNKKRWAIVFAVLAIVIAAVFVIIFVVMSGFGNTNSISLKQKYLNYVVNGDTNNSATGDMYSNSRSYYFDSVMTDGDMDIFIDFYNKSNKMLDEINNKLDNDSEKASVTMQKHLLDAFKTWYELDKYDDSASVAELYLSGGKDALDENILKKVDAVDSGSGGYLEDYKEGMTAYVDSVVNLVNFYYSVGCKGETVGQLLSCEQIIGGEQDGIVELNDNLALSENDISGAVKGMRKQFVAEAYYLVYGEVQSNE